jgi:hypothetical protein
MTLVGLSQRSYGLNAGWFQDRGSLTERWSTLTVSRLRGSGVLGR